MTFGNVIASVKQTLHITSDGGNYWGDTLIKQTINDSQVWLCAQNNWTCLQRNFNTTTLAGINQYDYPSLINAPYSFEDGCINSLFINGESYKKVEYDDFLQFINSENIKNRKDIRVFADFNRKIFVFPTPENTGDKMVALGLATPKSMANDSDKTIFDGCDPLFDRIIINRTVENLAVQDPKRKDQPYYKGNVVEDVQTLIKKTSGTRSNAHKIKPFLQVPNFFNN